MRINLRSTKILLCSALLLFIVACGQGLPTQEVEAKAEALFSSRLNESSQQVLGHYSEAFFAKRSKQSWESYLQSVESKLGRLQKFALRKRQTDTRYSGRFYVFEYQTFYEKGKAWETLTYINPNGAVTADLIAHQIKAKGL